MSERDCSTGEFIMSVEQAGGFYSPFLGPLRGSVLLAHHVLTSDFSGCARKDRLRLRMNLLQPELFKDGLFP